VVLQWRYNVQVQQVAKVLVKTAVGWRVREKVVYHDIGIGRSDKARGASDADAWLRWWRYGCSTVLYLVFVKSQSCLRRCYKKAV
jgi:hypothetical protein